jgi:hypothetical protein
VRFLHADPLLDSTEAKLIVVGSPVDSEHSAQKKLPVTTMRHIIEHSFVKWYFYFIDPYYSEVPAVLLVKKMPAVISKCYAWARVIQRDGVSLDSPGFMTVQLCNGMQRSGI